MDPNANINEQLQIATMLVDEIDFEDEDDRPSYDDLKDSALRLAELIHGLDEWMTKGGALPARWRRGR